MAISVFYVVSHCHFIPCVIFQNSKTGQRDLTMPQNMNILSTVKEENETIIVENVFRISVFISKL